MPGPFQVESLLAARLFMSPQIAGDRIYFISDLSGRMSLYSMLREGSVPQPLIPPGIALQNPILMEGGLSFFVFPGLGQVLVMIDRDGDENYQPMLVPMEGGIPRPLAGERFRGQQANCVHADAEKNLAFFQVDPRSTPIQQSLMADVASGEIVCLGESLYGSFYDGANADYSQIVLVDSYTAGDSVLYLLDRATGERRLLYGRPLEERQAGESVPLNSFAYCNFVADGRALLLFTSLFSDSYGLGYMPLDDPAAVRPVAIEGIRHSGMGELEHLEHLGGDRYLVAYNMDGCSWVYEGTFDEERLCLQVDWVVCGEGRLSNGVLQSISFEKATGRYALSFSTATSPTQIYTVEEGTLRQHTQERVLGIDHSLLSPGEDASYTSHDGLRISARLYMPAEGLGYEGRRPVIFYIHGGPQSQERPDFAWFSMPLIQFLTMNGFAVFVPNVRGSSGYGLSYMKRVDHDWGGQDRLDHVEAWKQLHSDPRLDLGRAGVTGRSYGGYMTLMLAGRHPELWRAAIDLFGPYNLLTFVERLPEAWKTYFYLALGHPEKERDLYIERSPSTYLHQLACPMLVIQGANDPRVREAESRDLVEALHAQGKAISLLVFENEGHDVLKIENKACCYREMVRFFVEHLGSS
jgi:pimeloyl-ACP methyl ester carboxylesterase